MRQIFRRVRSPDKQCKLKQYQANFGIAMATSANSFGSIFNKLAANQNVLTTAATIGLLDRAHYSSSGSSGHSGGGYYHHHSSGKKKKRSIALTALTLLSFLFFLNILQNCIQEHMTNMNPTMIVMQMSTTAATVRRSDRKGDDGDNILTNSSVLDKEFDDNSEQNFKRNKKNSVRRNDDNEQDSKQIVKRIQEDEKVFTVHRNEAEQETKVKKGLNNRNRERTKGTTTSTVKISPTKPSWFMSEEEYQFTHIPVKLKTVEKYKKKFKI